MCGGTVQPGQARYRGKGLSPRVRGNRGHNRLDAGSPGSIPACAGEPRNGNGPARLPAVYPRVCGGTISKQCCSGGIGGLSPRVRGNQLHPASLRSRSGLSPRVRGNRTRPPGFNRSLRSIPACAGEPTRKAIRPAAWAVYPRVCGGTVGIGSAGRPDSGLSPRVRGNPRAGMVNAGASRSIPACAGEPCGRLQMRANGTVYPRVCGGTLVIGLLVGGFLGLSPRVRGNHTAPV